MSINMLGRMADAEKLSVAQLQQVIQDGTLPAYIGVPLLQQKMQMQKQAQVSQAPAQPPVAQQVMAQAAQESAPRMPSQGIAQGIPSHGVDHLQSNLPTEHMAQGGIIAFEDGGQVPRFDGTHGPSEVGGAFTVATNPDDLAIQQQIAHQFEQVKADFNAGRLSKQAYMDRASELNNRLKFSLGNTAPQQASAQAPAESTDPYYAAQEKSFLAPSSLRKAGKAVGNAVGTYLDYTSLLPVTAAKAAYHGLQNLHDQNTMTIDPDTKQPISVANLRDKPITQAAQDVASQYKGQSANLGNLGIGSMADALRTTPLSDNPLASLMTPTDPTTEKTTASNNLKTSAPSSDALDQLALRLTKGSQGAGTGSAMGTFTDLPDNSADILALKEQPKSIQDFINERKVRMGDNPALAEREARLKKMEEETNTMEEKSPWLALMKAGLGTMRGTSQYALANVGAGGEEGLNDYIKSQDKISAKKEKQYDYQTALGDAKRAEQLANEAYGESSKQAQDAKNDRLDAQAIADKHATTFKNADLRTEYKKTNATIASDDARANMSAQVQLAINKADIESRNYIADQTTKRDVSKSIQALYDKAHDNAVNDIKLAVGDKGLDGTGMGPYKSVAEINAALAQRVVANQRAMGLPVIIPPGYSTAAPLAGKVQTDPKTGESVYVRNQ